MTGFETTHWSLIASAGRQIGQRENEALEELCARYWQPLYVFLRRKGHIESEAEDLVQSFFADFLSNRKLLVADRERGRFRTFLLTSLGNFVHNERAARSALKRGGGRSPLSMDVRSVEGNLVREPSVDRTAEDEFDRAWALVVIDNAMQRIAARYQERGKTRWFQALAPFLNAASTDLSYLDVAETLNSSPQAVKVAVHRLRREYRDSLTLTVRQTVAVESEIEDELAILLAALRK